MLAKHMVFANVCIFLGDMRKNPPSKRLNKQSLDQAWDSTTSAPEIARPAPFRYLEPIADKDLGVSQKPTTSELAPCQLSFQKKQTKSYQWFNQILSIGSGWLTRVLAKLRFQYRK